MQKRAHGGVVMPPTVQVPVQTNKRHFRARLDGVSFCRDPVLGRASRRLRRNLGTPSRTGTAPAGHSRAKATASR